MTERFFPDVAEWRMPDVVRKTCNLHQVRVGWRDLTVFPRCLPSVLILVPQALGGASTKLGDLQGMGQTRVVEAVLIARYDLSLACQATEGARVEDAVAVSREFAARVAAARALWYVPLEGERVVRQRNSVRRRVTERP